MLYHCTNRGGICTYIIHIYYILYIYILAFSVKEKNSFEQDEKLWSEIYLPKTKPIIVGTCYRLPKQNDFFGVQFEFNLYKLRSDSEIIVLGDFNICLFFCFFFTEMYMYHSSSHMEIFLKCLRQIIEEPTRINSTCTHRSLMDHILCNNNENIVQSSTISIGLSDYLLTFCTRKVSRGVFDKHNSVKIMSLKQYLFKWKFHNQIN